MKSFNLKDFIKGWFIGHFDLSIIKSDDFEVAVKKYKKGDYEKSHFHKISTEITVIVSGEVKMNNSIYRENDIIVIEPGEMTDFLCLTDVATTVIKVPSSKNDKYEV